MRCVPTAVKMMLHHLTTDKMVFLNPTIAMQDQQTMLARCKHIMVRAVADATSQKSEPSAIAEVDVPLQLRVSFRMMRNV